MAIEAGARAGMVAVDDTTIDYLRGRPFAPTGRLWDRAVAYWRTLMSDPGAKFDKVVTLDAADIKPQVTWGTSPEMVTTVDGKRARSGEGERSRRSASRMERALEYMGLEPTRRSPRSRSTRCSSAPAPIRASRTCARPRRWCEGKRVAGNVKLAMVVPGSGLVKRRPSGGARPGVHRGAASNGASRAARCASA